MRCSGPRCEGPLILVVSRAKDMPPTPIVVLEIDDNTPADLAPFSYDVSVWSFHRDLNLHTRTAAATPGRSTRRSAARDSAAIPSGSLAPRESCSMASWTRRR